MNHKLLSGVPCPLFWMEIEQHVQSLPHIDPACTHHQPWQNVLICPKWTQSVPNTRRLCWDALSEGRSCKLQVKAPITGPYTPKWRPNDEEENAHCWQGGWILNIHQRYLMDFSVKKWQNSLGAVHKWRHHRRGKGADKPKDDKWWHDISP